MNGLQTALLLVGSPRGPGSASAILGTYLVEKLKEKGIRTVSRHLCRELNRQTLLEEVEEADLLIISSPLYVDCLPAQVIKVLEWIGTARRGAGIKKYLAVILNCGLPEAYRNEIALAICRRFAIDAQLEWCGGLCLGMGPAVDGKSLQEAGSMVRHLRKALEISAKRLAEGNTVPREAVELFEEPFLPPRMYIFFDNLGWKQLARKNGVRDRIDARPYEAE